MTNDYITLRRLVVIVMSLVAFFILLSILLQYVYKNQPSAPILTTLYILMFATGVLDLVFLIISLRYILRLYKIACQCSDNGMRLTYMIYVIARLALIVFIVIGVVFIVLGVLIVLARISKTHSFPKPKSIKK
jgi:cytochrome b561